MESIQPPSAPQRGLCYRVLQALFEEVRSSMICDGLVNCYRSCVAFIARLRNLPISVLCHAFIWITFFILYFSAYLVYEDTFEGDDFGMVITIFLLSNLMC